MGQQYFGGARRRDPLGTSNGEKGKEVVFYDADEAGNFVDNENLPGRPPSFYLRLMYTPVKKKNERGKENNQGQGTQTKQTEAQEAPSL